MLESAPGPTEIDGTALRVELSRLIAEGHSGELSMRPSGCSAPSARWFTSRRRLSVCGGACIGQKAERLPRIDVQLSLALLALAIAGAGSAASADAEGAAAKVEEQLVTEHTRRKPVRKPLPADLPRVTIEFTPPEVERDPEAFVAIGSETREVLERRPAATVALRLVVQEVYAQGGPVPTAPWCSPPHPRMVAAPSSSRQVGSVQRLRINPRAYTSS
jgi:hypothetical protein